MKPHISKPRGLVWTKKGTATRGLGPWVFVGAPNVVKVWNIQTNVEFNLDAATGQVHAMVVGNEMLFAGTQDGAILVWKGGSETNPFRPAATLKGHTRAVGSVDHTIRVWELETLQCVITPNEHSDVVMSLICWDLYLISCSLDCAIKVWAATKEGNLQVIYTHSAEHGFLDLSGMTDSEVEPILLCSCSDNSVRLYKLPSFTERGRLFANVRTVEVGPGGLFFTGDAAGLLSAWKWTNDAGFKVSLHEPLLWWASCKKAH
ncbi:zinc finger CCCH domain-containing protein 48-like [Pyrus ussuriensis x Pyrus communis]|uniref:Zinc finger CCCH domain-containing protein 48-like n=1 Tax=Pyrus ussuriensis x Pyrus communis TaxID=2448454 RepID=A0A5N5FXY6_9ROSA|nr:zinc finger CCCH domain-containing protein 48-like [Pyrus ussuriensis x Pyrus communis]